jgi:hypothetical protein
MRCQLRFVIRGQAIQMRSAPTADAQVPLIEILTVVVSTAEHKRAFAKEALFGWQLHDTRLTFGATYQEQPTSFHRLQYQIAETDLPLRMQLINARRLSRSHRLQKFIF